MDDEEIWVIAPKGFRPSNWVDMLRDFDVAFELDPYLVDPGFMQRPDGRKEEILVIRLELLDVASPETAEHEARHALFWEMMERIASLGLQISFPARMAKEHPEPWTRAQEYCQARKVNFSNRGNA